MSSFNHVHHSNKRNVTVNNLSSLTATVCVEITITDVNSGIIVTEFFLNKRKTVLIGNVLVKI